MHCVKEDTFTTFNGLATQITKYLETLLEGNLGIRHGGIAVGLTDMTNHSLSREVKNSDEVRA